MGSAGQRPYQPGCIRCLNQAFSIGVAGQGLCFRARHENRGNSCWLTAAVLRRYTASASLVRDCTETMLRQGGSRMQFNNAVQTLITAGTSFGLLVLGAIAIWIVGRWLIRQATRLISRGL